jgi:uracil phosphoribosyltransferase
MKSNTDMIRLLTDQEAEPLGDFFWVNFWSELKKEPTSQVQTFLSRYILTLLYYQQANLNELPAHTETPNQLLNAMNNQERVELATHLVAAIQLVKHIKKLEEDAKQGEEYATSTLRFKIPEPGYDQLPEPIPLALQEKNPYILRLHIFALHHRMMAIMKMADKNGNWEERKNATVKATETALRAIQKISPKFEAFSHFLAGIAEHTLAIALPNEAKEHWSKAYKEFKLAEATEHEKPKAAYLVNLGRKDMYEPVNLENLQGYFNEITGQLTAADIQKLDFEVADQVAKVKARAR